MIVAQWHSLPMGKSSGGYNDNDSMALLVCEQVEQRLRRRWLNSAPCLRISQAEAITTMVKWHSLPINKLSGAHELQLIQIKNLDN